MTAFSSRFPQILLCFLCFLQVYTTSLSSQPEIVIINTEMIAGPTDGDVTINLVAKRFTDLITFQFAIAWDPTILAFQSVDNFGLEALEENAFGTTEALDQGKLGVIWITEDFINGNSLEEGDVIFSINFKRLSFVPHNISFLGGSFPINTIPIEIISVDGELVQLQSENTKIISPNHELSGLVFFDENGDCLYQDTEQGIPNLLIQFSDQNRLYAATTDSTGHYQFEAFPGKYTLESAFPLSDNWEICNIQDTTTISFDVVNTTNHRDIPISVSVDCPALSVNVSNNRIRRCFDEVFWINYVNQGTQVAQDAYVIVKFDPFLEIVESNVEGIDLGNNEYRYELGDVSPLESESIRVIAKTNCENTALGQTHCVEAFIFPNTDCNPVSDLWSMANLELTGTCTEDSVQFVLQNTGIGNMVAGVIYQVFENLNSIDSGFIQLNQEQALTISYPANGSTYRFQTNQVSNHPIPVSYTHLTLPTILLV